MAKFASLYVQAETLTLKHKCYEGVWEEETLFHPQAFLALIIKQTSDRLTTKNNQF